VVSECAELVGEEKFLFSSCLKLPPLSVHFNRHFSRWTWVSWYQNVSILDFVGVRVMEVVVTTGATRDAKLQTLPTTGFLRWP